MNSKLTASLLTAVLLISPLFSGVVMAADAPARLVAVAEVENRPLSPKIMVIGSVHSRNSAELTAGVSGKLEWVQEAGTRVNAGDIVARLEQTRLKLQLAEQQAMTKREQITLNKLKRNYSRLQSLENSHGVTQTELDDAKAELELAHNNLELAQIKTDLIADSLARTELKAPFAGIVTQRLHQAGEDIGPSESVVAITDPDNLEIRLHAPLKHSRRVKANDELRIYHAEGEFTARIRSLIPVSDVRSQTFEARLDLPLEMQELFSVGELVSLALPVAPARLTTLVPRDAIVLRSAGASVFRINADNTAEKIDVTLGDGEGKWIAVEGGLKEGDKVVIRGAETLQDGQQVKLDSAPTGGVSNIGSNAT